MKLVLGLDAPWSKQRLAPIGKYAILSKGTVGAEQASVDNFLKSTSTAKICTFTFSFFSPKGYGLVGSHWVNTLLLGYGVDRWSPGGFSAVDLWWVFRYQTLSWKMWKMRSWVVFCYGIKAFFIKLLIIYTMYFRILPVLPCVVLGMVVVVVVLRGQL